MRTASWSSRSTWAAKRRQLVAGIRAHYEPASLVGKQIVVVANLQPATLRGVESQGMLLAASDSDGRLALVVPERPVPRCVGEVTGRSRACRRCGHVGRPYRSV